MTTDEDELETLPDLVRGRLARFLAAVEKLPLHDLPLYAARPRDIATRDAAMDRARQAAEDHRRDGAIDAAAEAATDYLLRAYANAQVRPTWFGVDPGQSLGTALDRVTVARSLSEAIGALCLSDLLDEADVDELLGAWAELAA